MIYGSVCSGIEAATVAWHSLGWEPAWFAEIENFPSRVLAHHYPNVRNFGDFTTIGADVGPIDLLVGGTPCQSFSIAGLRGGLEDERGNLTLEYCRLADRLRPRWVVWENVPGVLSSNGGRDFGAIVGALAELGYGLAWRVLDAQHFGVPQRRRRVFLVGYLGDWRRAAAVLFEPESLRGNPPAGGKARKAATRRPGRGTTSGGRTAGTLPEIVGPLCARNTSHGHGASGTNNQDVYAGHVVPHPIAVHLTQDPISGPVAPALSAGSSEGCASLGILAFSSKDYGADVGTISPTLRAGEHDQSHANAGAPPAIVAFGRNNTSGPDRTAGALTAHGGPYGRQDFSSETFVLQSTVRRLTPRECERLQGFPADYTAIPGAADGPRYRALGNSFAVPVMRWIGERIQRVERIPRR